MHEIQRDIKFNASATWKCLVNGRTYLQIGDTVAMVDVTPIDGTEFVNVKKFHRIVISVRTIKFDERERDIIVFYGDKTDHAAIYHFGYDFALWESGMPHRVVVLKHKAAG